MTEIEKLLSLFSKEGPELSKKLNDGSISEKEAKLKVKSYSKAVRLFGKYVDASIKGDKKEAEKEFLDFLEKEYSKE